MGYFAAQGPRVPYVLAGAVLYSRRHCVTLSGTEKNPRVGFALQTGEVMLTWREASQRRWLTLEHKVIILVSFSKGVFVRRS